MIPSDKRAAMLETARKEQDALRIRSESQSATDKIMDAHESRAEALKAAREIADPEVRDSVVGRVNQRFSELDAIESEDMERIMTSASVQVEEFGTTDGIHRGDWLKLNLAERRALELRAQQVKSGIEPETVIDLWYSIQQQIAHDPKGFSNRNLMMDRAGLSNSDFQNFARIQTAIKEGSNDADQLLGGVRTATQVVDDTLRSIGIDASPEAGKQDATRVARFSRMVDERVQDFQIVNGRKAVTADVQAIVDELIIQGQQPGTKFFGLIPVSRDVRAFEAEEGFVATEVPQAEASKIHAALTRAGVPVTNEEVLRLYNLRLSQ
jgi:hypothetical protein